MMDDLTRAQTRLDDWEARTDVHERRVGNVSGLGINVGR